MCATLSTGHIRKAARVSNKAKGRSEIQAEKTGSTAIRNHSKLCADTSVLKFCHNFKSFCCFCDHLTSVVLQHKHYNPNVIRQYNKLIHAYA